MSARLSVDPELVRAYGAASAGHATDLQAAAARLSALSSGALGPVGARFITALTRAADGEARTVGALRGSVAAVCDAARDTARAYEAVDADSGARVAGTW